MGALEDGLHGIVAHSPGSTLKPTELPQPGVDNLYPLHPPLAASSDSSPTDVSLLPAKTERAGFVRKISA